MICTLLLLQFRNELLRKIYAQVPEIRIKFYVWKSAEGSVEMLSTFEFATKFGLLSYMIFAEKYLNKTKQALTLGKEFLSLATTLGMEESMIMIMSEEKAMSIVEKVSYVTSTPLSFISNIPSIG